MKRFAGVAVPMLALAVGIGLTSCASAPAVPPAVNPVGYFEFSTDVEGQLVTGSIEIRSADGGYTGVLSTDATEPVPVGSVVVNDQQVTISSDTPDGPVSLVLTFTGATFTGSWSYAGMSGVLSGRRIR